MIEKPLITTSGKKALLNSDLHQRIIQDLPQEGIEWRRRHDSNAKSVYIDVDLIEFAPTELKQHEQQQQVQSERISPDLAPSKLEADTSFSTSSEPSKIHPRTISTSTSSSKQSSTRPSSPGDELSVNITLNTSSSSGGPLKSPNVTIKTPHSASLASHAAQVKTRDAQDLEDHQAFFNRRLLGQPILHTYWADKTDFEIENKKSQFEEWIGQVQASNCTEWAIIIIEEGDFKAQLGTALFKSKLQSSTGQANISSSSIGSSLGGHSSSQSSSSFLDRMKKSLSTMFNSDVNSDRWLTLVNQDNITAQTTATATPTTSNSKSGSSSSEIAKAQESYAQFIRKFRNIIMASFSKQIELFEEQLRVQREIRNVKNWDFFSYFSMQEELAFAFEFLTLFDEALMQYDLLEALFTEHLRDESPYEKLISFDHWPALCLDLNSQHYKDLRARIVAKQVSLLDLRNYLFAKQCDLMLLQNQPWRVAASTIVFLHNCIREHERLKIKTFPGSLDSWAFISALEVLQKCECYSCTSTMENYSYHTVDIWNYARRKLLNLGQLFNKMPDVTDESRGETAPPSGSIQRLFAGLGPDPHDGVSYQKNEISPQARLSDALAGKSQFAKHLIELSELTLGTYKHIGRKRHALLIGKELAEFYVAQRNFKRALPFLIDYERTLVGERWTPLVENIQQMISKCNESAVSAPADADITEKLEKQLSVT